VFPEIIKVLNPKNDMEAYRVEAEKILKSKKAKIVSLGGNRCGQSAADGTERRCSQVHRCAAIRQHEFR
jgi:hypothetical protein